MIIQRAWIGAGVAAACLLVISGEASAAERRDAISRQIPLSNTRAGTAPATGANYGFFTPIAANPTDDLTVPVITLQPIDSSVPRRGPVDDVRGIRPIMMLPSTPPKRVVRGGQVIYIPAPAVTGFHINNPDPNAGNVDAAIGAR